MHSEAWSLLKEFALTLDRDKDYSVLEVGSKGSGPFTPRHLIRRSVKVESFIGIDIEQGEGVDVATDPYEWPFRNETFDLVVSVSTFEHIAQPWETMFEISRVLKVGGLACMIAPSNYVQDHKYPIDAFRYLPDGWRALGEWAGLAMVDCKRDEYGVWGDVRAVFKKEPQL